MTTKKDYLKAYYQSHRETILKQKSDYYQTHKEHILARQKAQKENKARQATYDPALSYAECERTIDRINWSIARHRNPRLEDILQIKAAINYHNGNYSTGIDKDKKQTAKTLNRAGFLNNLITPELHRCLFPHLYTRNY